MITIDPIKRPPKKSSSVDTTEIMKLVDLKITNLIDGAPETLDTIKELADAIENLPNLDNFVTNETLNKLLVVSKFEFVDLGLPSGLLWATCNVGANSPEEYGLYFAWGETEGYTTDDVTNGVRTFNWEEYKWCNGTYNSLTKYNTYSNYGTVDNKILLELEDDVVYNNDNSCRLPTYKDLKELKDNTTLTWESLNGVRGARLTGTNGNSIFIPAAGSFSSESGDGGANPGYTGYIVASTTLGNGTPKYPSRAWSYMVQSTYSSISYIPRFKGVPLRAVQDADADRKLFNPNNYYTKSEVEAKILELPTTETLNLAVQAVNSNINGVNQSINTRLQSVSETANKADTTATDALNLAEGIQESLSSFALKSELPTKISQLENDADYYITEEQLTLKGYITEETINNNLSNNYYTKSEVDAKILELQTLINNYINGTSQGSELDA